MLSRSVSLFVVISLVIFRLKILTEASEEYGVWVDEARQRWQ